MEMRMLGILLKKLGALLDQKYRYCLTPTAFLI